MSDSRRLIRAVALLSPLLLAGCDTVQSLDFSKITSLWEKPDQQPPAVSLRVETSDNTRVPDGMQMDDLHAPFGAAPPTVTASNGP